MSDRRRLINDLVIRELEDARADVSATKRRLESEYAMKGLGQSGALMQALLDVDLAVINRVLQKRVRIEAEGFGLGLPEAESDIRTFLDVRFASIEGELTRLCQAAGLGGVAAAFAASLPRRKEERLNYYLRELRILEGTTKASLSPAWPPSAVIPDVSEADVKLKQLYSAASFKRDLNASTMRCGDATPLSVVMLDVDDFKSVNEERGHIFADKVLETIAQCCVDVVAHRGRAYRWGGEELALILPNCSEDEAMALAERLRRGVTSRSNSQLGLAVTLSGGVASWKVASADAEALVEAADEALRSSKENGKDRISRHSTLEPQEQDPRPH